MSDQVATSTKIHYHVGETHYLRELESTDSNTGTREYESPLGFLEKTESDLKNKKGLVDHTRPKAFFKNFGNLPFIQCSNTLTNGRT